MKKLMKFSFLFISAVASVLVAASSSLYSQPRDAGQAVVPIGWENKDSIRFSIFDFSGVSYDDLYKPQGWGDSLQSNFETEWGTVPMNQNTQGKRKGYAAYGSSCSTYTNINTALQIVKQRVFYPSPQKPFAFPFDNGYWWRYNDINVLADPTKAKWHNNTYDENDISPYAEYFANSSLVKEHFFSKRYHTAGDSLLNGNEGRLILGYSDNRFANELFKTTDWYPFRSKSTTCWKWRHSHDADQCGNTTDIMFLPTRLTSITDRDSLQDSIRHIVWWRSGDSIEPTTVNAVGADRAAAFSVTLEFNIDTNNIIMDSTNLTEDNVPLLRLQVLYKKGAEVVNDIPIVGWDVLPFVPFRNKGGNSTGWHEALDKTITKSVYRGLPDNWRTEDKLADGSDARSWKFKQLHLIIPADSMIAAMKKLILHTDAPKGDYGGGRLGYPITGFYHQDSLVSYIDANWDSNAYKTAGSSALPTLQNSHFIEFRVLSMYRATVRIRSLAWQDTTVDKFFFRKRVTADSTYALNPQGTASSYYDDSLRAIVNNWAGQVPAGVSREVMLNDVSPAPEWSGLSTSMGSLMDWHLSQRNMSMHIREQEWVGRTISSHFRRERLSYDGKPPSVFENQVNVYYSNRLKHDWWKLTNTYDSAIIRENKLALDIFPHDYIYYGISVNKNLHWPYVDQDSMVGMIIGRKDTVGDGLNAYRQYTLNNAHYLNGDYLQNLRQSARIALQHPKNRRFAIESAIQGWAIIDVNSWKDTSQLWKWNFAQKDTLWDGDHNVRWIYDNRGAAYGPRPTTPEENQAMIYGSVANGVIAINNAQCFDKSGPKGGAPGAFGIGKRTNGLDFPFLVNSYNFGHRRTPWAEEWWTKPNSNDCDGDSPDYYIGYSNTYRSYKRALSRLNLIYDTNGYNRNYPFKRMEWLDAYSSYRTRDDISVPDTTDRPVYRKAFLQAFCTTPVKRWERGSRNEYIDSTSAGKLVPDSLRRTYVEVGLFKDHPGDTLKGYGALVVNTRLWPSLRDAEDTAYYNAGVDSLKDHARSTLGDIDTRKVWFWIVDANFDPAFRGNYYIIRDTWHQDTTYFVHRDSAFAIYMKPGEARLLYIEKGIAINVAKKGSTPTAEFAFNNGRRVAEILNTRQSVVTFVRDSQLWVSYPAAGERFEGYNERTAGENIATGYEVCIDTNHNCHRPSICAGMNDTSIAITYWSSEGGGRVKVAYQKAPYAPWSFANTGAIIFSDTTTDFSGCTPVIAPYGEDTTTQYQHLKYPTIQTDWWVAATYLNPNPPKVSGIAALRFHVDDASGIHFITEFPMKYFNEDKAVDVSERSVFPTITSRPLKNGNYPVRLAWQKGGRIYHDRYNWAQATSKIIRAGAKDISFGLPSYCYNMHPSIGVSCLRYPDAAPPPPNPCCPGNCCPATTTSTSTTAVSQVAGIPNKDYKLNDYVVWESKIAGKRYNSRDNYWPVLRQRIQYLDITIPPTNQWTNFRIFKPHVDSAGFHWPIVSAASRNDSVSNRFAVNKKAYFDAVRIGWHDASTTYTAIDSLEFVHFTNTWRLTRLNELGLHPSLPQSTWQVDVMGDSSIVPQSIAFVGKQAEGKYKHVRITNGWFPQIAKDKVPKGAVGYMVFINPDTLNVCSFNVAYHGVIGTPSVISSSSTTEIAWIPTSLSDQNVFPESWPTLITNPAAFHSDTIRINPSDSIVIPRTLDTVNLSGLRAALKDSTDYFRAKLVLRRVIDTSWVATIDSLVITKKVALYPGNGEDSNYATYKYPSTKSSDSTFITIELERGNILNGLFLSFSEYFSGESMSMEPAYKRTSENQPKTTIQSGAPLQMTVHPNPLSLEANITITIPEEGKLQVELYNLGGSKLQTLYSGKGSGEIHLTLDGKLLPTGTYFLRAQWGNSVVTRKVELIK